MRRMPKFLVLILVAVMLIGTTGSTQANTEAGQPLYFSETGHTLGYGFRVFWEKNGGLAIFGFPVTEVFMENGRPVQYFERARLEWHADLGIVLAGHLGKWAAADRMHLPAFAARSGIAYPGQLFFPETSHTLGGLFRQYWENNGAIWSFGYPLSEEFMEVNPQDGQTYTVQYFERARFEYHPELPSRYRVSLGHLGWQYLNATGSAPSWSYNKVDSADQSWNAVRPTRVRLPRIGVDTTIVEAGFSLGQWDVPRYTAAHYWPVAGFPGSVGNIVIAGHVGYRDIIFSKLPNVAMGDDLYLTVNGQDKKYRVDEIYTLLPQETWVMAPTSEEVVTLITCVPIGVYTHRLIVRARPVR